MKKIVITFVLAASTLAAYAQYTGPSDATVTTVKELQSTGKDDQYVTLRGHIVKQVSGKKYQFADSTGQMPVKIEEKSWPADQKISDAINVEVTGKYDKEWFGESKLEVKQIKVVH
ncbi:MAG: NirD/YgiW/YdeI family stress tolerance protein [Burkholderiales bacterium]|nr:NirD/YgiW/YdeI family stress tolerance protein [Burkholderiales bacterium]